MAEKPKDLFLMEGISMMVFNKDYTQCALSKKDYDIYIYQVPNIKDTSTWTLLYTLKNHFQYISGLDWNPVTNKILSCSYDKTSFVWNFKGDKWVFDNVVAADNKISYLFCSWNRRGDKFVEGTGSKALYVGYYSEESKWWACRKISNHKKTSVICAKIDPSSLYVLSGATDMKVIVSNCYMKDIDDNYVTESEVAPVKKLKFGQALYEFEAGSWLINCNWSLDGKYAYTSCQGGYVYVIQFNEKKEDKICISQSPISMIIPKGNNAFYAVGYNREIYLYEEENGQWVMKKQITKKEKPKEEKKNNTPMGGSGGVAAALKRFQNQGMKKKESLVVTTEQNENLHATNISSFAIKDNQIITSDLAGFVKYWEI